MSSTYNHSLGQLSSLDDFEISFRFRLFSAAAGWRSVLHIGGTDFVRLPVIHVIPHYHNLSDGGSKSAPNSSSYDSYDSYGSYGSYDSYDSSGSSNSSYDSYDSIRQQRWKGQSSSDSYSYSEDPPSYASYDQRMANRQERKEAVEGELFFRLHILYFYGTSMERLKFEKATWGGVRVWDTDLGLSTNPLKYQRDGSIEHTIRVTMRQGRINVFANNVSQTMVDDGGYMYHSRLPLHSDSFPLYVGGASASAPPADALVRDVIFRPATRPPPPPTPPSPPPWPPLPPSTVQSQAASTPSTHPSVVMPISLLVPFVMALAIMALVLLLRRLQLLSCWRWCCHHLPECPVRQLRAVHLHHRRDAGQKSLLALSGNTDVSLASIPATICELPRHLSTPTRSTPSATPPLAPQAPLPTQAPTAAAAAAELRAPTAAAAAVEQFTPDRLQINWDAKLGEGGMGSVYLGTWLGTRVAVKVIKGMQAANGNADGDGGSSRRRLQRGLQE